MFKFKDRSSFALVTVLGTLLLSSVTNAWGQGQCPQPGAIPSPVAPAPQVASGDVIPPPVPPLSLPAGTSWQDYYSLSDPNYSTTMIYNNVLNTTSSQTEWEIEVIDPNSGTITYLGVTYIPTPGMPVPAGINSYVMVDMYTGEPLMAKSVSTTNSPDGTTTTTSTTISSNNGNGTYTVTYAGMAITTTDPCGILITQSPLINSSDIYNSDGTLVGPAVPVPPCPDPAMIPAPIAPAPAPPAVPNNIYPIIPIG